MLTGDKPVQGHLIPRPDDDISTPDQMERRYCASLARRLLDYEIDPKNFFRKGGRRWTWLSDDRS